MDKITPPVLPKAAANESDEQYGRTCCEVGIFNERAAVLVELDHLAREFDDSRKPNTAKKIRESAQRIDARLREGWR